MNRYPFTNRAARLEPRERRRKEAGQWLLALQEAELSERMLEAWNKWESVPENREAFEEVERVWALADDLPELPAASPDELAQERFGSASVSARLPGVGGSKGTELRHGVWRTVGFAAAAAVLIVLSIPLLQFLMRSVAGDSEPLRTMLIETGVAQHKRVVLDDGSSVQLGAQTSFTATFSKGVRAVALDRGEAHFNVAHDSRRPFQVSAGGGTATAVGTAFNVKRRHDDVVVTVTEGAVEVVPVTNAAGMSKHARTGDEAGALRVASGEEVVYDSSGNVSPIRLTQAANTMAWRDGYFMYTREPLRHVIEDVNRYSRQQFVVEDAAAGDLIYTGTVFTGNVPEWILGLGKTYPEIEIVVIDDSRALIRARAEAKAITE